MPALRAVLVLALAAPRPTTAQAQGPGDSHLVAGAYANGRVYVLTSTGAMRSFTRGDDAPREEVPGGRPLGVCAVGGRLVALVDEGELWSVLERSAARWGLATRFARPGGAFVGLQCGPGTIRVVTGDAVTTIRDRRPATVPLSESLDDLSSCHPAGGCTSLRPIVRYESGLAIGASLGEFGGRLRRLDPTTGLVGPLGGRPEGGLDATRLPVRDLAVAPWNRGCVIVAAGLAHLGVTSGTVAELCGDRLRPLLQRGPTPDGTGFWSAVTLGSGVLVAGDDGLYRLTAETARREPYPAFRTIGGIHVSFELPGVVLVRGRSPRVLLVATGEKPDREKRDPTGSNRPKEGRVRE